MIPEQVIESALVSFVNVSKEISKKHYDEALEFRESIENNEVFKRQLVKHILKFKDAILRENLSEQINFLKKEHSHIDVIPNNLKSAKDSTERDLLLKTLNDHFWVKSKVCKVLSMDRKTLYNKIKKHGL